MSKLFPPHSGPTPGVEEETLKNKTPIVIIMSSDKKSVI